ncbi:MAG: transglutaminase domain-containing protein [Deltaproteobacteria bacterium]|nr:transglutaminase domain-containing protein [Deltaproteobacteria bacterium]
MKRCRYSKFAWLIVLVWVAGIDTKAGAMTFSADTARRYHLTAQLRVDLPPVNGHLALWIPYPVDDASQHVLNFTMEGPLKGRLHRDPVYGNRMVYWEGPTHSVSFPLVLKLSWLVERRGITAPRPLDGDLEGYRRPLAEPQLLEPIRAMAARAVRPEMTARQKWAALYDYVYGIMRYDKDGTGWGEGDPVWICTRKRGNCTDFHSLLIMLGQTQGLTARFNMGLPIATDASSGTIAGYHCWAELFDEAGHWIVVDASEAKKRGEKDAYFGRLPPDRIQFSRGRHLVLNPPQQGPLLNYFISPYAELDGRPYDGVTVEWSYREPARLN